MGLRCRSFIRLIPGLAVLLAPALIAVAPLAGAESSLDRLKSLIEEKRRLEWDNGSLTQELAFAATPAPYILVDVPRRTFEFRVRGKTHKKYEALKIEIHDGRGRPMTLSDFSLSAPDPLEVLDKAGGPPEIKPPSNDPADPTGAGGANQNVSAGDAGGADPNLGVRRTDAGVLGVDAPTDYDISLENGIRIEIRTRPDESGLGKTWRSLGEIGAAVSHAIKSWFSGDDARRGAEATPAVRVEVDPNLGKAIYHSLLPGEHVYFLPPPPLPIALVASLTPPERGTPPSPGRDAKPRPKPAAAPPKSVPRG